jgi:hypothetical protein
VHVWNDDDPEEHHYFWTFTGGPMPSWEEWWILIGAVMEAHGMEL